MAYPSADTQSYGYHANGHTSGRPNAAFEIQVQVPPVPILQQQHHNQAVYEAQLKNAPSTHYQRQQQLAHHPPARGHAPQFAPIPTSSAAKSESLDTVNSGGLPIDYQILLLSLAEDYFDAAYGRGSMVALATRALEVEQYNRLISLGLGCLETVLKVQTCPWLKLIGPNYC